MNYPPSLTLRGAPQRGVSLLIVLVMLVIIGLTAASTLRTAASEQQLGNNLRTSALAQQYAEAALRFCEAQLLLNDAARVPTLREALIPATLAAAPDWQLPGTWTGAVGAAATRTNVPAAVISTVGQTTPSATLPQCVVERQSLGNPVFTVLVVTARGFSPDYQRDANGNTTSGSVVWLQSILNR